MGEKYALVTSLEYDANQLEADGLPVASRLKQSEVQTVKELIEALNGIISNTDEYGHADESWFEAGRAALAKARGGQP